MLCRVLHGTPLSRSYAITAFIALYGLFIWGHFDLCGNCHWDADSRFRPCEHMSISCSWHSQPFLSVSAPVPWHSYQLYSVDKFPHFHKACWQSQNTCSVDCRVVWHDWKFIFMMASWPLSHCWKVTVLIQVPCTVSNMIGAQLFTLIYFLFWPNEPSD